MQCVEMRDSTNKVCLTCSRKPTPAAAETLRWPMFRAGGKRTDSWKSLRWSDTPVAPVVPTKLTGATPSLK